MSGGELQERGELRDLREQVVEANRGLVTAGLVTLSFGNASGVERDRGVLLIKPSGLACDELRPQDVVAVSLRDGSVLEGGGLRPSSDTPTHLALYRHFESIGGVVHTHSPYASAWAQAGRAIPCLGTTHADHFAAPVPVTRQLTADEIAGDYELETGRVIIETLEEAGLDPSHMPAALVASHGPFTWGADAAEAVTSGVALEAVAALAWRTLALALAPAPGSAAGSTAEPTAISRALSARHFARKHGPNAYYGQPVDGGAPT